MNTTHLDTLQLRLSNERMRLNAARTERERTIRRVWVAQLEREIAGEVAFLADDTKQTDEQLLADLLKDSAL